MKSNLLIRSLTIVLSLYAAGIHAQTAQISEKQIQLPTYLFSDPNPIPEMGKIYPYYRYDGYSDKSSVRTWKMIEMENDYIRLWVTPEIGGKIWGAVEKSTGKEFVYYNHAVKFRDIAMRGPWTSGGIELNFGVIGHAPTCSTPVDYLIRKNDDGSVSCFVGAIDLPSHTRWSVEINLPKDKAYFTTRSQWDNPSGMEQSYYHWMNLGVKTAGNLEYIFPGNCYLGHDGDHNPWPVNDKGRNISFYNNNDFGSYKSYHVFGEPSGFYGAFWHDDDFGFVHYSPYDEKPGKKVWIWGLSDQGMIWEKLLTDTDGQYTEIQSGRLFNQAAGKSSLTPFKNRGFPAGTTDQWTEYWFPVKGTKGLKNALPVGSVNLEQNDGKVNVSFCPNETVSSELKVRSGNNVLFRKAVNARPLEIVSGSFGYGGQYKDLTVWLGDKLLFDADREKSVTKRPVDPPSGFNGATVYAHYLAGKELERQRLYKTAAREYEKALEGDAWFVPALTGMANLAYRKTDYRQAFDYSLKALSVDTYDPEANMIYGLSGLALGDTISAIDGFSIASANILTRVSACNALASVFLQKGNFQEALSYAEKSMVFNQVGVEAAQLKVLCLRKLGRQREAGEQLAKMEENDPLNHFIRIERFLAKPASENKALVQKYITNELPAETYLEYAMWYIRNKQFTDALNVLAATPQQQPVVLLFEAFLNHLAGKETEAKELLSKAIGQSPELVFPYRSETLTALEWARLQQDNWKLTYYEGLVYLNAGDEEKGAELWKECKNTPDFAPFYIARSKTDMVPANQQADVERALLLAGNDWRTVLFASKFYMARGNIMKAEALARDCYRKNPDNYYLGLHLAGLLEKNNKYQECIGLLQKIKVLPYEGADDGYIVWRNVNLNYALGRMEAGKYRKALESIALARQWPPNLGVGKPYDVDERLEDFMALQCYKKLGDRTSADEITKGLMNTTGQNDSESVIGQFISIWLIKESGDKSKSDQILNKLISENSSSKAAQWCKAMYSGDITRAEVVVNEIEKNGDFMLFTKVLNIH